MSSAQSAPFDFRNPPPEYGEVAFFWWHGDPITKEKLSWILDQLKDSAICGLQINYCHGNSGGRQWGLTMPSDPKPFSDAWWELIKWFTEECGKYGISVSLSDYTLSAPGQGYFMDRVLEQHPEMIGQRLTMNRGEVEIEKVPYSLNPMAKGVGEAYTDVFYGAFERHLPGKCGKGINYFFSDELQFNVRGNLWCDDFREEFLKRKGYDITKKWKAIFRDEGDLTPKIRLDYYDVIVQLSEERYFKVVYGWHETRKMTFGCDHGGRGRDITEFGDYFRAMKWYQGPGNDQPALRSDVIKSKCSASIAHMYHRPRVWLEGFYGSGWATTCDEVADAVFRNFALGHNLLSLHGLYYSTHGSMWEWAPPCNHHHMPYWKQMRSLLECTRRLSYFNASGTHCCDVAVIYPVAEAEAHGERAKQAAGAAFEAAEYLYAHGVDFDFIDFESILRADVCNGMLCVSGERFRTVVVPEMHAVRFEMMKRLNAFAAAGGQVLFLRCTPEESDRIGRNDALLNETVHAIPGADEVLEHPRQVVEKTARRYVPDFRCDTENAYFHHRRIDEKDYYLVYRVPQGTRLRFRAKGQPVVLDPWSGEKYRFDDFYTYTENGAEVTELHMPVSDRELLILLFDPDMPSQRRLAPYRPFCADDEILSLSGEWECELVSTMDNRYGDWRLPAFNGKIGAEAREMKYRICEPDGKSFSNAVWKRSVYSYGTYFYVAEGSLDEEELIAAKNPTEEMKEYRFSLKYGVEGDAGPQNSYHGLKGRLSDEFLVMGKKKLTYANSDSVYEGDGPYYFFTTVLADQTVPVQIETGTYRPDRIWIDGKEPEGDRVTLSPGHHSVLLRFPHGGRSYFVLKKEERFRQELPLVTRWFGNPDILPFDAKPEQAGKYVCFRFTAPPGARTMKVNALVPVKAYAGETDLKEIADNQFALYADKATDVTVVARQIPGAYDTALLSGPVTFDTRIGRYDAGRSPEEQGLNFYSGGIRLKKMFFLPQNGKRRFFAADPTVGCAFDVYVNGKKAGTMTAPPYRCEITPFLHDGENEIKIEAFNSLHNHMKTIPTNYNQPHAPLK